KLDALASLPASMSPSIGQEADPETGEVTDQTNSATNPGSAEAGQADHPGPDKAGLANNKPASTQPTANSPAETAASGQAAPESSNPPRSKDDGAATAADKIPTNEREYIDATTIWITNLIDA